MFQAMRMVHALKWRGEDFKWGTALFYVYNSPSETASRWNEVGRRSCQVPDHAHSCGSSLISWLGAGRAQRQRSHAAGV